MSRPTGAVAVLLSTLIVGLVAGALAVAPASARTAHGVRGLIVIRTPDRVTMPRSGCIDVKVRVHASAVASGKTWLIELATKAPHSAVWRNGTWDEGTGRGVAIDSVVRQTVCRPFDPAGKYRLRVTFSTGSSPVDLAHRDHANSWTKVATK